MRLKLNYPNFKMCLSRIQTSWWEGTWEGWVLDRLKINCHESCKLQEFFFFLDKKFKSCLQTCYNVYSLRHISGQTFGGIVLWKGHMTSHMSGKCLTAKLHPLFQKYLMIFPIFYNEYIIYLWIRQVQFGSINKNMKMNLKLNSMFWKNDIMNKQNASPVSET